MSDRAVSTTLSYSLTLSISALLVVGLLTAGGTFISDQRDDVVESELEVIGERLAADISTADRLVEMGDGPTNVSVYSRLPSTVSGSSYDVEVRADNGNASLRLTTRSLDRNVDVPVANTTDLSPGATSGGDLAIVYNDSSDSLEVRDA